jgi:hypothetical protein
VDFCLITGDGNLVLQVTGLSVDLDAIMQVLLLFSEKKVRSKKLLQFSKE